MLDDINQCRLRWTEDNSLLAVAMSSGTVEVIWFHFSGKKCIFKPNVVPLCLRELENRDRKKCVLGINPPSEPLTKLLKQSWHFDTDCQPCPGGGHSGQPRIHHHLSLHPCFSAWMD